VLRQGDASRKSEKLPAGARTEIGSAAHADWTLGSRILEGSAVFLALLSGRGGFGCEAERGGVLSLAGVDEAWLSFAAWMMTPVGEPWGDSTESSAESGSTITVRVLVAEGPWLCGDVGDGVGQTAIFLSRPRCFSIAVTRTSSWRPLAVRCPGQGSKELPFIIGSS
jgi:hypothetical protein